MGTVKSIMMVGTFIFAMPAAVASLDKRTEELRELKERTLQLQRELDAEKQKLRGISLTPRTKKRLERKAHRKNKPVKTSPVP